jgi:hypothetical protein
MWAATSAAHRGANHEEAAMHPYHTINLAHEHVAELHTAATRTRLARRARRERGARSPAPGRGGDLVPLRFLPEHDERRPAA